MFGGEHCAPLFYNECKLLNTQNKRLKLSTHTKWMYQFVRFVSDVSVSKKRVT